MEPLTLTELASRMTARWPVLAVAATTGALAGLGWHVAVPPRYEAVSVVRVDADDPGRVDMAAEQALASSRRVTAEALDALGEPTVSIDDLEQAAGSSVVTSSRVLHVTFRATRPRTAARGADALANAYLAVRSIDARAGARAGADDGATTTAEVVDPARVPGSPVGPTRPLTMLAGLVLGGLAAAPAAARPRRPATRTPAAPAS